MSSTLFSPGGDIYDVDPTKRLHISPVGASGNVDYLQTSSAAGGTTFTLTGTSARTNVQAIDGVYSQYPDGYLPVVMMGPSGSSRNSYEFTHSTGPNETVTSDAELYIYKFNVDTPKAMISARSLNTSATGSTSFYLWKDGPVWEVVATCTIYPDVNVDGSGYTQGFFATPIILTTGNYVAGSVRNLGDSVPTLETGLSIPADNDQGLQAFAPKYYRHGPFNVAELLTDATGPQLATRAIFAFFEYKSLIAISIIGGGAIALTNGISFHPGGSANGTSTPKYTIAPTAPAANRAYNISDIGVDGSISVEESYSFVSDYGDNTGATTYIPAYNHYVSRKNNQVTITFPTISPLFDISGGPAVLAMTLLPARFRPTGSGVGFVANVLVNNIRQLGLVLIGPTGAISWTRDAAQSTWAAATNNLFYSTSVTYLVA